MPELPEVETMRRGIVAIREAQIVGIEFPACRYRPIRMVPDRRHWRKRVLGTTIRRIRRLGKRLVLELDNRLRIVIEPRMTGLVLLSDPPDPDHLRIGFRLSNSSAPWLWFWDRRGLGSVQLLDAGQFAEQLGPHRVGPDALRVEVSRLSLRLASSQREIKVALLDQKAVAGIGNLYASEILHVARIHPRQRCHELTGRQWQRLHEAMQKVLREAIRYEGSTLADGTYRNALNRAGRYQNHHRVYGRQDQLCPQCQRQRILRFVQAQRSTFCCPRCQPLRGRSSNRPRASLELPR